jgi:phospholipase D1/2
VRQLHLDAITHARQFIFAENQYFTSGLIANALEQRLAGADAPEMALLVPAIQAGWLEASTMGVLRARIHRGLRAADPAGRYQLYCPSRACDDVAGRCINVHSKVLVVDDEFLTVGSANLSNRSMHLDTECNLALAAAGDPRVRATIAGLRERLLAEHLGVDAGAVQRSIADTRSLHATIEALANPQDRWLQRLEPPLDPAIDALTPDHDVLDPERPLDLDVVVTDLLPAHRSRNNVRLRLTAILLAVAALSALALAWRYTGLNQYLNLQAMIASGTHIRASAWAPLLVPAIFVLAGLVMVPLTLMIAVTAVVFGPLEGAALALAGAMCSASVGYAIGRSLGRNALRRIAGKRLGDLSRRLAKRGLIAMLVVRLLPVAPYTVINLVAGASSIGWRDYLIGTALGLFPGLLMITALVDRAVVAIRAPSAASVSILVLVVAGFLTLGWLLHRKFREPPAEEQVRR